MLTVIPLKFKLEQYFQKMLMELPIVYHNDPKFLDRQVWANSADPDQTAPRGAFLGAV